MLNRKNAMRIFVILFVLVVIPISIHPQTSQNTLDQYVSELQKNPEDMALREQIIKLALTLDPPPAVPEEAERFMARGIAAIKGAKEPNDFADAVAEFQKAALAAPWLANVYNNLGIAQDKAGQYAEAINSLKLYLLAAPDATDAKDIKALIYEIEYRQEKAAKEAETAASEAEAEAQEIELQKSARAEADRRIREQSANLAGSWLEFGRYDDKRDEKQANKHFHYEFEIQGTNLIKTMVCVVATTEADQIGVPCEEGKRIENWSLPIQGNRISGQDIFGNTWEGVMGEGTIIMHWVNVRGKEIRYVREN